MKKVLVLLPSAETGGIHRMAGHALTQLAHYCDAKVLQVPERAGFFKKVLFVMRVWRMLPNVERVVSLHLHLLKPAWLFRKKQVFVFTHGLEVWRSGRFVEQWTYLTNSRMNYFYLKGFNQNMRVLQAYYPGLEPEVFEAVAPDHPVLNVLTVSRLSMSDRYKGVGLLIETVNRMHRDGIAVSLTIAGSGDAMDIFIKLAGPAVQFVQAPDDHELNLLYSRATVFALPSTHEGQGLVYIEALAFGLPIVALKETVAEEFLTDRENALLISQDADGLYEALRYFGENRNERNRMAVNARRSFEAMQINQRFNKLVATIVED